MLPDNFHISQFTWHPPSRRLYAFRGELFNGDWKRHIEDIIIIEGKKKVQQFEFNRTESFKPFISADINLLLYMIFSPLNPSIDVTVWVSLTRI